VRDAIGDDIDVMVDFNQALNLADALRRCHMIDDQGLGRGTRPLDDFDGCARLTGLKTGVAVDYPELWRELAVMLLDTTLQGPRPSGTGPKSVGERAYIQPPLAPEGG
jgi:hypothetical protein